MLEIHLHGPKHTTNYCDMWFKDEIWGLSIGELISSLQNIIGASLIFTMFSKPSSCAPTK